MDEPIQNIIYIYTYIHSNVVMKLYRYLKQTKMSFFKNRGQEGKTGYVWGLVPLGGEDIRKG
jgi:hypothetical protein